MRVPWPVLALRSLSPLSSSSRSRPSHRPPQRRRRRSRRAAARTSSAAPRSTCRSTARAPRPGRSRCTTPIQRRGPKKVLIALSGGPGQSGVSSASSFAISLDPALRRYRLAVLDQRGTGKSGVLSCPNLQRLRSLDAYTPQAVANCANRIGPRRAFYTTADTVLDIDALRQALGADKIALMGISYGTHVALQYARAFPEHVDRLILDSIVGPDGPDAFLLDTYRNMPRVLAEQCAHGALPQRDEGPGRRRRRARAADQRRAARCAATTTTRTGASAPRSTRTPDELSFLLIAGDLNPFLQAALPAAISAARRGDTAPLMRLRRIGQGGHDAPGGPVGRPQRRHRLHRRDAALPARGARAPTARPSPSRRSPRSRRPTTTPSTPRPSCARATSTTAWPGPATRSARRSPGRCPTCRRCCSAAAWTRARRSRTRAPPPRSCRTRRSWPCKGSGHDALDSDITGCTAQALARFIEDVAVGHPCLNRDNGVAPDAAAAALARRTSARRPASAAAAGARCSRCSTPSPTRAWPRCRRCSRACRCAAAGCAAGASPAEASFEGRLRLRGYAFVPGLRVSGSLVLQRGVDLGHRARERDRERHPEDQPPRHGDRHARRASRPLPARRGRRRRRRCASGGSLWPRTFAPRRLPPVR